MYHYNGKDEHDKIQHWAMTHQPDDDMMFKEGFWSNIVFLRDKIIPMWYYKDTYKDTTMRWEDIIKEMGTNYDIIGSHRSKSIKLPVILMRYKGAEIVFRNNFYNYEITVLCDHEIELPTNLFSSNDKTNFYYEGFPKEYCIFTPYSESKAKFSVTLGDDYTFYTFMFILKNELIKYYDLIV